MHGVNTFLLVLAAIFPVVNPPGGALVFLALTRGAPPEVRRATARKVARNAFLLLVGSFLIGAGILRLYGISIPVLRVAGGLIVAISGWHLLNEGSSKDIEGADENARANPLDQAFYPLTLPLTTGPGTIAVMISLGLSNVYYEDPKDELIFVIASLLAILVMAATIYWSFAYADRIQK